MGNLVYLIELFQNGYVDRILECTGLQTPLSLTSRRLLESVHHTASLALANMQRHDTVARKPRRALFGRLLAGHSGEAFWGDLDDGGAAAVKCQLARELIHRYLP